MMLIRRTPILSGLAVLLVGGLASAEEVKAEATVEAPKVETAAPEVTTTAEPTPEPVVETPAPEPAVEAVAVEEAPEEESSSGVSYLLFGDAFATFNTAQPGSAVPLHRAYTQAVDGNSPPGGHSQDGFSLAWIGLDLAYDGGQIGVTTSIRAGSAVVPYFGTTGDGRMFGPVSITQGFVTWKPIDALAFDLGMFGTPFGAEVVENWNNFNYTRGALYYGYQPFWHTGLRASYALSDTLTIRALLTDEANQIALLGPGGSGNLQAGAQIAYASDGVTAALGTLQTLGDSTYLGFDRFVDLVLGYSSDKFGVLFNGDFNVNDGADTSYLGLSLAARYFFVPAFGVALRGEFIKPNIDVSNNELVTGTLTFDIKPVSGADNLLIRWDNRVESQTGVFFNRDGNPTDAWFESTLGFVAYTSGVL
jgi:hypothetical protein